jgi:hypothetical protein
MGYFGLYFPELITPYILEAFLASSANTLTSRSLETCKPTNIKICTYNFYPCTKILRTQKFAKQALFTTVKEIIHDINSPLTLSHTDIEYITTFLRHTCVLSS